MAKGKQAKDMAEAAASSARPTPVTSSRKTSRKMAPTSNISKAASSFKAVTSNNDQKQSERRSKKANDKADPHKDKVKKIPVPGDRIMVKMIGKQREPVRVMEVVDKVSFALVSYKDWQKHFDEYKPMTSVSFWHGYPLPPSGCSLVFFFFFLRILCVF